MKLSLSGRILQGSPTPLSPADFIHLARDTGFDLVELRADQVPVDSSEAELAALHRVLDDAGIGVSMLVIGGVAEVDSWIRVARALGVLNLRVNGTVDSIAAAADAMPADVRLVTQMHSGSSFENVAQSAANLTRIPSPRFGLMPEPANLLFAGERWSPELFAPLQERIYGCNAQSIALDPDSGNRVMMNDGRQIGYKRLDWRDNHDLDFPGFLAALRAVGYDDFINFIDPSDPGMSLQELAAGTAAYARECLAAV